MHISDLNRYSRCPKKYYYALQDDGNDYFPYYNFIISSKESIIDKLKIKECYFGEVGQSNEDSFNAIEKYNWLFDLRFVYRDLRVKVPLMYYENHHCRIYFIYYNTSPNISEARTIRLTKDVIEKNGIEVDDINILYLNSDYVRGEELDNDRLWIMTDNFSTGSNPAKNIMNYCLGLNVSVDELIDEINAYEFADEENKYSSKCSGKNRCSYYEKCFPDEVDYEDNSILTLVSSSKKHELFKKGIKYLKDAAVEDIEGGRVQYAQIMADKNGGLFADKAALKQWIGQNISYPLSLLDFEWDLYPIPPYEKMKPLSVMCFQYSLDVFDGNDVKHYQFVQTGDCRREMAEGLIANLPETGSILAYNATGAEKLRIKELAEYFPQYKKQLMNICSRLVDLALPFSNGLVYDTRMRGAFSLKVLEEIVDKDNSYSNLDISDGLKAVEIYRLLTRCDNLQQKEIYLKQLYEYCGLDSLSMLKVYQWLVELSQ